MPLALTRREQQMIDGGDGPGVAMAMRVVAELASAQDADRLVEVTGAHVGATFDGPSSRDWLQALVDGGARFGVPTTLNVASFDLLHPQLWRGTREDEAYAREVMDLYVALGGVQTWTCAPYLLKDLPAFGERVAWTESGAVMYANSVLGARTDRGGSLVDVCAAITGRMPDVGLYADEGRRATRRVRLEGFSDAQLDEELTHHLLGFCIGERLGVEVPLVEGLPPDVTKEQLQSFGAAMAVAGSMGMFHALGITPEAPTAEVAFGGDVLVVTPADLRAVSDDLTSATGRRVDAVCLGTPHYSFAQFVQLVAALEESDAPHATAFYVNTNRHVQGELAAAGLDRVLADAGVRVVTDTCTYHAPLLGPEVRRVMTNSAKWAQYGGAHHAVEIVLGSTRDCVRSARAGEVRRDDAFWS